MKFTGQLRDVETGLDYFGARYMSSAQGRFTSPDPLSVTNARLTDPQQFNLYAYVRNNPFRLIDPTGLDPVPAACQGPTSGNCYTVSAEGEEQQAGQDAAPERQYSSEAARYWDRTVGALKGEANYFLDLTILGNYTGRFTPSSAQQADAMSNVKDVTPVLDVGLAIATRGPKGMKGEGPVPYARPSGATTAAQREAVQGQPCAICGTTGRKNNAGHKEALVKEYYKEGTIDKAKMRSVDAVRPECPTCSNREGSYMKSFSNAMKKLFFGQGG